MENVFFAYMHVCMYVHAYIHTYVRMYISTHILINQSNRILIDAKSTVMNLTGIITIIVWLERSKVCKYAYPVLQIFMLLDMYIDR